MVVLDVAVDGGVGGHALCRLLGRQVSVPDDCDAERGDTWTKSVSVSPCEGSQGWSGGPGPMRDALACEMASSGAWRAEAPCEPRRTVGWWSELVVGTAGRSIVVVAVKPDQLLGALGVSALRTREPQVGFTVKLKNKRFGKVSQSGSSSKQFPPVLLVSISPASSRTFLSVAVAVASTGRP